MLNVILSYFAQASQALPNVPANTDTLQRLLDIVFGAAGSLSVLFVVIGGFQYITSGGDSQNTAKAKNTIIFAVVGLAVSISAFAMVTFVLGYL